MQANCNFCFVNINFQSGNSKFVRLFGLRLMCYNRVTIANVLSLLLRPLA